MSYYAFIINNEINGKGQCPCTADNLECIEISEDIYNNLEHYIYNGSEIVLNPDYDKILLDKAKAEKIALNDELRDTALSGGVTYQNVLFDSDTDQKINLSETIRDMSDSDTIVWYGMDNTGLLCCKADLVNIGEEIRSLTKHCWEMNAYIKEQIENAGTLEELDMIKIDYSL